MDRVDVKYVLMTEDEARLLMAILVEVDTLSETQDGFLHPGDHDSAMKEMDLVDLIADQLKL
jgi:hypothetical protein